MTKAYLPAPKENYTFKVYLVGVEEPKSVRAADWNIVAGDYVFVDRDGKKVESIPKETVDHID